MAFSPAGVIFVVRGVDTFVRILDRANKGMGQFNDEMTAVGERFDKFESSLGNLGNVVITGLIASFVALGVVVGGLSILGLNVAASFESSFADVTKTVEAFIDRTATAESGVIQLTESGIEFRQSLMDLSEEIPVAFEELSKIAGLGGQLGIVEGLAGDEAKDALVSFTETVAGLAEATNLTQEKAATGLAQISNIYRGSIEDIGDNIERLGATIVELGNTSATTESMILNFSQRIAGAGQTIGLTQAEVLGISTAFASIGITAEAGATAVNRSLLIMNEAIANSTNKFVDNTDAIEKTQEQISDLNADLVRLEYQTGITGQSLIDQKMAFIESGGAVEDFGRQLGDARREQLFKTQTAINDLTEQLTQLLSGQGAVVNTEVFNEFLRVIQNTAEGADLTAESFKTLFDEKPAEAFSLFVEGLAKEGKNAGQVLADIGLGSVEATRAFLAIAGASDTVRGRILVAVEAFEENSALIDEVSVRYATLQSRMVTLQNTFRNVAFIIFNDFIPSMTSMVLEAKEVVSVIGERWPLIIDAITSRFQDLVFPGIDFSGLDISQAVQDRLDAFIETIKTVDVTPINDAITFFKDTVLPLWSEAMEFATEHSDAFLGALKGLGVFLASAALFSGITKLVTAIGFLTTPLGQVTLLAIGLGIAWETNFLNIQEVTATVVTSVTKSIGTLLESIRSVDLGLLFGGLTSGGEQEIDGHIISGEMIGLGPTNIQKLERAAERVTEIIGALVSFIVAVPVDQIGGFINIFNGLIQVFDGLRTSSEKLANAGIENIVSGFITALFAPLQNLAEMFMVRLDFSRVEKWITESLISLKDSAIAGVNDFIMGFTQAMVGVDTTELGESVSGLADSVGELGGVVIDTTAMQWLRDNLSTIAEKVKEFTTEFSKLVVSVKELLGIEDVSTAEALGRLLGFIIRVPLDQLTGVVIAIDGIVTVLTGIVDLDLRKIGEGFSSIGEGLVKIATAPIINLDALLGEEKIQELSIRAAALSQALGENIRLGGFGPQVSEWVTETTKSITDGINTVIDNIKNLAAINLDIEDFITFDFDVESGRQELALEFAEWLESLTRLIPEELKLPAGVTFDIEATFEGILKDVDLGLPSFDSLISKAEEVSDKIKEFFSNILDDLDFGFLETLGIFDVEVDADAADTSGIAKDLSNGLIYDLGLEEESWQEAWLDFFLSPIELGKEKLGIKSASTVTQEIGSDVVAGYALGLSDLTPIEASMNNLSDLINEGFGRISLSILSNVMPSLEGLDLKFTNLYSDTIPRLTGIISSDLIPIKLELTEVNLNDLIPSVDMLIEAEENLEEQLDDVWSSMDKLIEIKKKSKDESKRLVKEIDLLTKSYLALAEAIGAASRAGSGLSSAPSAPVSPPAGQPFQTGGSFIVPDSVGSEGMPIRVHAKELVQIIPAEFVSRLQSVPIDMVPVSVKSPQISGATISNVINTQQTSTKEFHLHVTESPTSDVRGSFDLLEALS